MAVITAYWFGPTFLSAFNKEMDLNSDSIKCALFTTAPSQDSDRYFADLPASEVDSGTYPTYTAGGKAVTTPTIAYATGTNIFNFTGDAVSWTAATFACRYAIVYDATPGLAATNPLISYVDFGETITVTNGTFTITWAAGGIAQVTVS